MPRFKLAIIGAGSVGSTIAYALVLHRLPIAILLHDVDTLRAEGEAMDLQDCTLDTDTSVATGSIKDAGQADMIVITAGVKQKAGETRRNLLVRNREIMTSIMSGMQPLNPNAIILIVANPVEALCHLAQQLSGLPRPQVFGAGTYLDSARLRSELSKIVGVHEGSIHCHVLGEHGDGQFVCWSGAEVGGAPLLDFPEMKGVDRNFLARQTAYKAYAIIARKGSTYYGIGAAVAALAQAVVHDSRRTFPVTCFNEEVQCYISHPAILGAKGVERLLCIRLDELEKEKYQEAVQTISKVIQGLEPIKPPAKEEDVEEEGAED